MMERAEMHNIRDILGLVLQTELLPTTSCGRAEGLGQPAAVEIVFAVEDAFAVSSSG